MNPALAKARKIRSDLFALGWPDPIMTDSGNGAQLMYRIDLPATDGGLVQKCTNAFALASDDAVSIDTSVHNPARIWRLPGTMNCKGDSIPERPHRMAKLLEAPDNLQAVSETKRPIIFWRFQRRNCWMSPHGMIRIPDIWEIPPSHQISSLTPGSRSTESGFFPSARSMRRTQTSPPC